NPRRVQHASSRSCSSPAPGFGHRFSRSVHLWRAGSGRHTAKSPGSWFFFLGERRQIFYARQLQRVHHLNDRAERSFLIRLQSERRLSLFRQTTHRSFQFVHVYGSSIQLDLIIFTDAHNRVIELRRLFLSGLRLRQIDLHFWLILFERRRNDKKYQQDNENIDKRNDDDDGRSSLSY